MRLFSLAATGLVSVALLAGAIGCKQATGKKLSVKSPANASLNQGDTTVIVVEVVREDFNDSVELKFGGLPDGVTIVENDTTVAKDAKTAKLTLKAAADAKPVDDHKVTVTASSGAMKHEATFKVSVKKAGEKGGGDAGKKISLKAPADLTLKQGDSAPLTIEITRDKFNDPVELKFANLPDGVTISEKDTTIPKDATSLKLTLKSTAEAKTVDDHRVTVSASGGGMTQEATFKVSIKKKT